MPDIPIAVVFALEDGAQLASLDGRSAARRLARRVQVAERHGLTAVTFDDVPLATGDRWAGVDPVQRAAFAAPLTHGIGLIPVTRPGYAEPFHVATQLASLDWASSGRAGWIPDARSTSRDALAAGADPLSPAQLRRERDEAIAVSQLLWDSWDDDAVIADIATGRYLDADRLHYVDFVGSRYTVKGPLITPRPPQGRPLVVADAGVAGIDIALVEAGAGPTDGPAEIDEDAVEVARAAGAQRVWARLRIGAVDRAGAIRLAATVRDIRPVVDGVHVSVESGDVDAALEEIGRTTLAALDEPGSGIRRAVPHAGRTLRDTLGLERPASRFARPDRDAQTDRQAHREIA